MGNGPSLNRTPLHFLEAEVVWGVNRCYLLYDRIHWRPRFFVAVDTRVVPDNASEINLHVAENPKVIHFFPRHFRIQGDLESARNVYWYNEVFPHPGSINPEEYFSLSAESFVSGVFTVTIAAAQLAVWMGFNPIYLIGCDTDYQIPASVKYEARNENLLLSTADDDTNHFSPDYFGDGKKYHQPYPEKMTVGYQHMKAVCDSAGIDVYNATVGGKLEVFPRVDFEALFADPNPLDKQKVNQ